MAGPVQTAGLGRRRQNKARLDEEDASELNLGAGFQNELCLAVSEVRAVLKTLKAIPFRQDSMGNSMLSDQVKKMDTYTELYSYFHNDTTIAEVRATISRIAAEAAEQNATGKTLHNFEIAQLMNLCPEDAEEARALIPSLTIDKMDDDHLDDLCKQIHILKDAQ